MPYALANRLFDETAEYVALRLEHDGIEYGSLPVIGVSLTVSLPLTDARLLRRMDRDDVDLPPAE